MLSARIVGAGRAGRSLATALSAAGWLVHPLLGRDSDLAHAAAGVDLLVLAVPDGAVAGVAAAVAPAPGDHGPVVAHLAGALGLDVLEPHERRASIHPLRSLPTAETPLAGAWFAVDGASEDDVAVARAVVTSVGGRCVDVPAARRTTYHAAAAVAANHLVALLGQVERLAAEAGVPFAAYEDLVRGAVGNAFARGPASALTGPVARGDWATVARHLEELPESERSAYRALAAEAARLAGRELPVELAP